MQVTKRKYQANGFLSFEKVAVCQSGSGTQNSFRVRWGERISKEKTQTKLYK